MRKEIHPAALLFAALLGAAAASPGRAGTVKTGAAPVVSPVPAGAGVAGAGASLQKAPSLSPTLPGAPGALSLTLLPALPQSAARPQAAAAAVARPAPVAQPAVAAAALAVPGAARASAPDAARPAPVRLDAAMAAPREKAPASSRAALEKASGEITGGSDIAGALGRLYSGRSSAPDSAIAAAPRIHRPSKVRLHRSPPETEAAPSAKTGTLKLPDGRALTVELAVTEAELKRGMSHRTAVPRDGLLFTMGTDGEYAYTHKNILVAVDYVFLAADGKVLSTVKDVPPAPPGTPWRSLRIIEAPAHRFALVLPAGASKGLEVGAKVDGLAALETVVEPLPPGTMWRLLTSQDPAAAETMRAALLERAFAEDSFERALEQARRLPRTGAQAEAVRNNLYTLLTEEMAGYSLPEQGVRGLVANYFPEVYKRVHGAQGFSATLAAFLGLPGYWHEQAHTFFHEAGHWVVGWALGARPTALHVYGSGGGVTTFDSMPAQAWKRVLISWAGPAAETLFSLLLLLGTGFVGSWSLPALMEVGHVATAGEILRMPELWAVVGAALTAAGTLLHVLRSPDGWRYDVVSAVWDMGFKRLSAEIGARMERLADPDAPKRTFASMARQTLLPHALNAQGRWDAPVPPESHGGGV